MGLFYTYGHVTKKSGKFAKFKGAYTDTSFPTIPYCPWPTLHRSGFKIDATMSHAWALKMIQSNFKWCILCMKSSLSPCLSPVTNGNTFIGSSMKWGYHIHVWFSRGGGCEGRWYYCNWTPNWLPQWLHWAINHSPVKHWNSFTMCSCSSEQTMTDSAFELGVLITVYKLLCSNLSRRKKKFTDWLVSEWHCRPQEVLISYWWGYYY